MRAVSDNKLPALLLHCEQYHYYFILCYLLLTIHETQSAIHFLMSVMVVSWYGGRSTAASRITRIRRRYWPVLRAGYNYNLPAVPGMMASIADTAGKGHYHNSCYCCNY